MKKTLKCFVHYNTSSYAKCFEAWSINMTGSDALIFVVAVDVEFEVPDDFDPRPAQIKALQEKQTKAAADFHALQTDIMRQINELQALEMTA